MCRQTASGRRPSPQRTVAGCSGSRRCSPPKPTESGGPRPSANPFSPAIGTHGHLWFAMFSHGLVGLGLYVAWVLASMSRALRPRDPVSMMLACVVIVGGVQMFFYKLVPVSLPIILVAIGLMFRTDAPPDSSPQHAVSRRPVGSHA